MRDGIAAARLGLPSVALVTEAFWPQGGGPNKSTYVMMFAIFEKGVQQNLIGIGSAITMVFLAFVMFLTLIQRWLVERKVHY